jgi:DNA repair exonuclease SbcCD nuclease subunit
MAKIVHAADLHIDSPMVGVEKYPGVPVEKLRSATRDAFRNLVTFTLDEGAELLILAGDLFDDNWRDYATGLYFLSELSRLRDSAKVVFIRGNHDAQSHVTRHLQLPPHVKELATRKPETFVLEDLGIAIHGQGYAQRETTQDLATAYPSPVSGMLNVGLLHTSLDGREGHASYAPTSARTLASKGYDYWALGHVHAREIVSRQPWIVFPGNLQGRNVRETGSKGATLITAQSGVVADVTHVPLDVVRWNVVEVDATEAEDDEAALGLFARALEEQGRTLEGRLGVARVIVRAKQKLLGELLSDEEHFSSELRNVANTAAGDSWAIERIKLTLENQSVASTTPDLGPLFAGSAANTAAALVDPALIARAREKLRGLHARMPKESRDAFPLEDDATLAQLLAEANAYLSRALSESEDG